MFRRQSWLKVGLTEVDAEGVEVRSREFSEPIELLRQRPSRPFKLFPDLEEPIRSGKKGRHDVLVGVGLFPPGHIQVVDTTDGLLLLEEECIEPGGQRVRDHSGSR
jgi:hypothetical protein